MFGLFEDPFESRDNKQTPSTQSPADTYRDILAFHAKGEIDRIIEGRGFEDNSSVHERMLLNSETEIHIVAEKIKPQIFDQERVLEAAKVFLDKESTQLKVSIPIGKREDIDAFESTEFYRVASDTASGRNRFYIELFDIARESFVQRQQDITIGDDNMFHIQSGLNDARYILGGAEANFNAPETVVKMKQDIEQALLGVQKKYSGFHA